MRCLASLLLLPAVIRAAEPAGYYATATGLTGTPLRAELHRLVKTPHVALSYSPGTRTALEYCDEDPANSANLILIYTRRSEPKTNFVKSPPQNTTEWNREHLWPDSRGILGEGADYSDLFNLRPADVGVNSDRANLAFEETAAGTGAIVPGSAEAPLTSRDSNSWEPPPEVKGDIARSMFYMALRYDGGSADELDLMLTDNLSLVTGNQPVMGRLTTLLLWHLADPVSPAEMLRNDRVFEKQKNRNPFIDRPEWVKAVYGDPMFMQSRIAGSQVTITWWAGLENGTLESSASLTGAWTAISGTPSVDAGLASLTSSGVSGRRFYRVRYRGIEAP